jgi:hypothetical protein
MAKSGYPISRERTRSKLRFVFVSSGIQDINKVIDYDYVGFYNRIRTFNLALGDYNFKTNTVLNTIPLFFDDFPKHALLVTSYVNANYDELVNGYTFFGGSENTIELFERDKKYDTVIVMKKN